MEKVYLKIVEDSDSYSLVSESDLLNVCELFHKFKFKEETAVAVRDVY